MLRHHFTQIRLMDATLTLLLNGSENLYLDSIAMLATKAWVWLPLYCAIFYVLVREHDFRTFIYLVFGLAVTILLCDQVSSSIVKPLVARPRPSHAPEIAHLVDVVNGYRGGSYGFFSSHAANTMGITTYLSLSFRHRRTTFTLGAWTLLNCWTRVYLGVHYVGDIMVGLLFGAIVGWAMHEALKQMLHSSAALHYSTTRLSVIETTFLLTLIIATIPWRVYF